MIAGALQTALFTAHGPTKIAGKAPASWPAPTSTSSPDQDMALGDVSRRDLCPVILEGSRKDRAVFFNVSNVEDRMQK